MIKGRDIFGAPTISIVMDIIDGVTLSNILYPNKKRRKNANPLVLKERYEIAVDIITKLEHLHTKKVAHLDIKANNIIIDRHNRSKIIDYGMSANIPKNNNTIPNYDHGKYKLKNFYAPELLSSSCYNPAKADIYSLGFVLFQLLGDHPSERFCFDEHSKNRTEGYLYTRNH